MQKDLVTPGTISALGIVACLIAYVTKGSIPDVLALIATTSAGGFLGVTIPNRSTP